MAPETLFGILSVPAILNNLLKGTDLDLKKEKRIGNLYAKNSYRNKDYKRGINKFCTEDKAACCNCIFSLRFYQVRSGI